MAQDSITEESRGLSGLLNPGRWPYTELVVEAMERAIDAESHGQAWGTRARAESRVMHALHDFERGWLDTDERMAAQRALAAQWREGWVALSKAMEPHLESLEELAAAAGAIEVHEGVALVMPALRRDALHDLRRIIREPPPAPVPRKLRRRGYASARASLAPLREGRLRDGRRVARSVSDLDLAHAVLEAPTAWRWSRKSGMGLCQDIRDDVLYPDDDVVAGARVLAHRIARALRP